MHLPVNMAACRVRILNSKLWSASKRRPLIILLRPCIWILVKIYDILVVVAVILLLFDGLYCPLRLPRILILSLPLTLAGGISQPRVGPGSLSRELLDILRCLLLKLQQGIWGEIVKSIVGTELVIVVDVGHAIDEYTRPYIWPCGITNAGHVTSLNSGDVRDQDAKSVVEVTCL